MQVHYCLLIIIIGVQKKSNFSKTQYIGHQLQQPLTCTLNFPLRYTKKSRETKSGIANSKQSEMITVLLQLAMLCI